MCGDVPVTLGAQAYLEGWYERFGFRRSGPGYVEDGIPHVPMRREPGREPTARRRCWTPPPIRLRRTLAARTTAGDWRVTGLLASRPEVVAHGRTAAPSTSPRPGRATAAWIAALSPAVAGAARRRWLRIGRRCRAGRAGGGRPSPGTARPPRLPSELCSTSEHI